MDRLGKSVLMKPMRPSITSGLLVCDECVKVSDENAHGWRALHGVNEDDTVDVVVLCPACAAAFDPDADAEA